MAKGFSDLRGFLKALTAEREVRQIEAEVDPFLEIAEIHRRTIQENGPVLLFNRVRGSRFPVVTNLFGTEKRVDIAFGTDGRKVIERLAQAPERLLPPSLANLWRERDLLWRLTKVGLRTASKAKVTEVEVTPPDLEQLPLLTTWNEDGGPFITLPLVYTQHPRNKIPNLGMYRIQRHSKTTTGLHMQIGKGGGFHLAAAKEVGESLPVNIFIGGPPAAILAAITPLPENVPELLLASLMLGERLELAKVGNHPLPLLANAEFVLCGSCNPNEMQPEGPFGDHYGYYSLKHDYPVFRCSTLYHRKDAIYPATVVGKPRQEDYYIGNYLQELLSPIFPLVMPAVKSIWSYGETGFHSLAAAVVQERYKREAMASAFRILGEGQLSLTKFLLLTDSAIDLKNFKLTLEHILARADFRTDLFIFSNLSMDTLDYSGPKINEGSKGVLLGLGQPIRNLPVIFSGEIPRGFTNPKLYCRGCLAISGPAYKAEPKAAERLAAAPALADWPLIVLCDDSEKAIRTTQDFLWTTFTRFEPAADIYSRSTTLTRFHPSVTPPLVIDCRMKPNYPDELNCDPDTANLVDKRWSEYFP